MYQRKIPLDLDCGTGIALEVILSKWKHCILQEIDRGVRRPKDLTAAIPGITKRVLHEQLHQLEFYGIVDKVIYPIIPPRVEYSLTPLGKTALPIVQAVNQWGLGFAPNLKSLRDRQLEE
ncbi:winged helix-turn-helix transcriptional regulator [Flavobacterium sp. JP2137]|uniref:winged helix-turn-helix transcriptional regulator n=1 Tax=Flavobacterium sp. JP2137 TaxID=3414510 RepID=UPI003D300751